MSWSSLWGALWYLESRSLWNQLRARLRQLRQPRYLVAFVLGGAYFLLQLAQAGVLGLSMRHGEGGQTMGSPFPEGLQGENIAATLVFGYLLLRWLLAADRAVLDFNEVEVAQLFPAPVPRAWLVAYAIVRSQAGILFTTGILVVFTGRILLGTRAILPTVGWWLLLSTVKLHGLGASFAVQRMRERGLASGKRRLVTLLVPVGGLLLLLAWYCALPDLPPTEGPEWTDRWVAQGRQFLAEVFRRGPAPWLLTPFRWMVAPLFASGWWDALGRCVPALLLLAAHGAWVLRSAVAFEEATALRSQQLAEARQRAAQQPGVGADSVGVLGPAKEPFPLAPLGPRWVALLWSGLVESGETPKRLGLTAGLVVAFLGILSALVASEVRDILALVLVCMLPLIMLGGSHVASLRFGRSLAQLELVKALPVAGWEVFLASIMGALPKGFILQWGLAAGSVLLGVASRLAGGHRGMLAADVVDSVIALGLLAMVAAPLGTVFLTLPLCSGLVLFPAWFASGRAASGIESTGYRILTFSFQALAALAGLLPVAFVGIPVFFLVAWGLPTSVAVLVAGTAATGVLAVECALGIRWIGRRFDQLDAAQER